MTVQSWRYLRSMSSIKHLLYFIVVFGFTSMVTYVHVNEKVVLKKILDELWNRDRTYRNRWYDIAESNLIGDCHLPTLVNLDDFFNYGRNKASMKCKYLAELGGDARVVEDLYPYNMGSRVVCLDEIKKGNCTVLSFGISNDPSFDFDFYHKANCSVYMFDPTTGGNLFPLFQKMKFFTLGLGGKREQIGVIGNHPIMIDRYESILKMLNLTNKVIDYLKVDIDGYEVSFLEDILTSSPNLLKNAKQFAMEIHPGIHRPNVTFREMLKPLWKSMHQLECLGFSLISFVPNLNGGCSFEYNNRNVSGCFDIVYKQISVNSTIK